MFYTWGWFMKLRYAVWVLFLGMAGIAQAAEKPYQAGKIADLQQKVNTRVLYYLVNTPITEDDPYYEMSVRIGNTVYGGVYTPKHRGDTLPVDWKPDAQVQVRIEGRHFYVKGSAGQDIDFAIAKRTTAKPAP
jgi:hypothetical protein